jgi:hypothetical protein
MFDGTELSTIGMITASVQHSLSGKRMRMNFCVASKHNQAIIGMKACQELELLTINRQNVCVVHENRLSSPSS